MCAYVCGFQGELCDRGVRARRRGGARRNSDAVAWWMCGVESGSLPVGRRSGATPVPTEYCLGYNLPR